MLDDWRVSGIIPDRRETAIGDSLEAEGKLVMVLWNRAKADLATAIGDSFGYARKHA